MNCKPKFVITTTMNMASNFGKIYHQSVAKQAKMQIAVVSPIPQGDRNSIQHASAMQTHLTTNKNTKSGKQQETQKSQSNNTMMTVTAELGGHTTDFR